MKLTTRYHFGQYLNELGLTGRGVEVGTHQGCFASDILHIWKGDKLYLVDAWRRVEFWKDEPSMLNQDHTMNMLATVKRLEPFRERVCVIRELSTDAAELFQDGSLDFVYIDADHSREAVLADLRAWFPKVKYGGIIAGHDYLKKDLPCGGAYGVIEAVEEYFGRLGMMSEIQVTEDADPSWVFVKRSLFQQPSKRTALSLASDSLGSFSRSSIQETSITET